MSEQHQQSNSTLLPLVLGPTLAVLSFLVLKQLDWSTAACCTTAVTLLCAIWWIFEPIPIPATSIIPLAVFPVAGVLTPAQVGESYGSPLILLLLGGFILSTAMARSGAHLRIALNMVRFFGGHSSRTLVFGFMSASALLSMWISNTATTLMLLPVALAVLEKSPDNKLATPLLLGIGYAASLGGVGTPVGTPPNLVFREIYQLNTGTEVSFLHWMSWGVPVVLLFLPCMALWLTRNLHFKGDISMPEVGKWQPGESRVFIIFSITALAWITRSQPFGGWSYLFNLPGANDASVALLAVVLMFIVPNGKGEKLLDWDTANNIPWGMLILFGGGIAIAKAFVISGLSATLGDLLTGITVWPVVLMIAVLCLVVTFMTEITSNTATTTLLMPILAAAGIAAGIDPALLMVPAAMSASCAFMLPVATAPNTIMFSTGRFTVKTMAREGFALNLIGAAVITLICFTLV